jgi:hypothetical protein
MSRGSLRRMKMTLSPPQKETVSPGPDPMALCWDSRIRARAYGLPVERMVGAFRCSECGPMSRGAIF